MGKSEPFRRNEPTDRRSFVSSSLLAGASFSISSISISSKRLFGDEPLDTDQWIRNRARNAPLSMQFSGRTQADATTWQQKFRTKLSDLLGDHERPKNWKQRIENVTEFDDHIRTQLILTADGHPPLPAYLLKPKTKNKRLPGILAIHGHGDYGYKTVAGCDENEGVKKAIRNSNYDYGRQLARNGYAVVVPCLTPFGRRRGKPYSGTDACAVTFVRMQLLGKVLMAENLRDCLWGLELLSQQADVEENRLGCVGLSYGGRMAMLASALETRIKVSVISGALNVMQERIMGRYSCGAQVIPGLLQFGDVPEIISLIAPRTCVIETGKADRLIVKGWANDAMKKIKRVYKALQVPDKVIRDEFVGGHRWNGKVALPILEQELKGN